MSGAVATRLPAVRDGPARRAASAVGRREWVGLAVVAAAAALVRLVNLPARGGWDSDQGTEMLALWRAVSDGRLPVFGPQALSVGSFHHGALYYDLLLPAAWLGGGDPVFVVLEITLGGLAAVAAIWWLARSIGGPVAGIAAAALAAASAALVQYSVFIWNPTLIEPAAALAFAAAWQAWRTRRARWWIGAALACDVAAQSHLAAGVLVLPLLAVFVADFVRAGAERRRALAAAGAGAIGLVLLTLLPLLAHELTHGFEETRGMLAFFGAPSAAAGSEVSPIARAIFAAIRIVAWPLTRWPEVDRTAAALPALVVALAFYGGLAALVWRALRSRRRRTPTSEPAPGAEPAAPDGDTALDAEQDGVRFVAGSLGLLVLALGFGLRKVSELNALPTEQYHAVADSLVLVAAGLMVGALWRYRPGPGTWLGSAPGTQALGRVAAIAVVVALVAWNAPRWPALSAYDGGWPAAERAAQRIQAAAGRDAIGFVAMPADKGADAYVYPLTRAGAALADPSSAPVVVVLCDSYWVKAPAATCGGPAEAAWLASAPASSGAALVLVDRFAAAPDRTLSVYRRTP